jgi:hypothetical protein
MIRPLLSAPVRNEQLDAVESIRPNRPTKLRYATHDGNLIFQGKHPGPKIKPLAVLPTDDASTIAVVTEDGTVLAYEVTC